MYPVIRGAGGASPGSALSTAASTANDTSAWAATYTLALPAAAKAGDLLLVFTSTDSGLPAACPVPTIPDHTFTLETTSGGDSTTGLHGRSYHCELQSDGAKTVTLTAPNNPSGKNDTAAIWLLLDGSTVLKPADPGWLRNTAQIAASTSHTISAVDADTSRTGNTLAIAFLTNDAADASASRAYTAPTGWTKQAEIGSRQFLDSAIFTRTYEGEVGTASAAAAYGASAAYTRMNVLVRGVPDTAVKVEHVATRVAATLPGTGAWCDKPPGSIADDEPSTFRFTGQSTCRQRVIIQRFRGVHPRWPVLTGPTFGANTATAATSHMAPDVAWSPRSMLAAVWTTAGPLGTYTNPTGFSNVVRSGDPDEFIGGTEPWVSGTSSGTSPATYSVSAVWNAAALVLRAADDAASGVEVLIAWHSMNAAQSSGTMATPDWGGWTLLGTMTRVSTSGAANFKVYMLVVKAPQPLQWRAADGPGSTGTTGLEIGYTGTQRQQPGSTNVSGPAPLPVEPAPFGRPGLAIRADIDAPPAQRAEHNPNHRQFTNGDDYYFSFAFALPPGYPTWVNDFNVIEQIHAASDQGSPVVSFEVRDWSLRYRGGDGKPGASPSNAYLYNIPLVQNLRVGRWYHVVYRILFHEDPAVTAVDIWVDGERIINTHRPPGGTVYMDSIPASNGPGPSYRKQGIYKRTTIEGGGPGLQPWHAGSALGRSYAAVDPTRLHTPSSSPELFAASA